MIEPKKINRKRFRVCTDEFFNGSQVFLDLDRNMKCYRGINGPVYLPQKTAGFEISFAEARQIANDLAQHSRAISAMQKALEKGFLIDSESIVKTELEGFPSARFIMRHSEYGSVNIMFHAHIERMPTEIANKIKAGFLGKDEQLGNNGKTAREKAKLAEARTEAKKASDPYAAKKPEQRKLREKGGAKKRGKKCKSQK